MEFIKGKKSTQFQFGVGPSYVSDISEKSFQNYVFSDPILAFLASKWP
jgi:hypothetical protein